MKSIPGRHKNLLAVYSSQNNGKLKKINVVFVIRYSAHLEYPLFLVVPRARYVVVYVRYAAVATLLSAISTLVNSGPKSSKNKTAEHYRQAILNRRLAIKDVYHGKRKLN